MGRVSIAALANVATAPGMAAPVAPWSQCISNLAVAMNLAVALGVTLVPLPRALAEDAKPHPALSGAPQVTSNVHGRPGDPVNIAFVGSDEELHRAMATAGWFPADPITLKTSLRIAADVIIRKPYADAPVSNLYLWGRKQDVAFEQPVGKSPKQRHHVRFWRSADVDENDEPMWLGAATYDLRVEISRTTGGITHRIAPDVDSERNKLVKDTRDAGYLRGVYWIESFHQFREGRNGGGDPYFTDGRLAVGVLSIRR